mmetsp:Transcript_155325/g.289779  ORF Transcript_155325/g.289779 Transcript_155325/m.289779 type:complete len:214 (+) Transcript_155325:523-1164(+)
MLRLLRGGALLWTAPFSGMSLGIWLIGRANLGGLKLPTRLTTRWPVNTKAGCIWRRRMSRKSFRELVLWSVLLFMQTVMAWVQLIVGWRTGQPQKRLQCGPLLQGQPRKRPLCSPITKRSQFPRRKLQSLPQRNLPQHRLPQRRLQILQQRPLRSLPHGRSCGHGQLLKVPLQMEQMLTTFLRMANLASNDKAKADLRGRATANTMAFASTSS